MKIGVNELELCSSIPSSSLRSQFLTSSTLTLSPKLSIFTFPPGPAEILGEDLSLDNLDVRLFTIVGIFFLAALST